MKTLSYLKLAYDVQKIYWPKYNLGKYSDTDIYYLFVVGSIPVCINTYRKMIKEDVSDFLRLTQENKKRKLASYQKLLDQKSKKRIK